MSAVVERLRAELRDDSAGVATPAPRLTWTVASDEPGWVQASAELRSNDRTVLLDGSDSVLVAWPFAPLEAGASCEVAVRLTAENGQRTGWSAPLRIDAAFTDAWQGVLIGLAQPDRAAQPALLRREFPVGAGLRRARLFFTALGAAEVELNGEPVDAGVLAPGWTSYRDRVVHETIDVTDSLHEGDNTIGVRLAGAWYTEKYGFHGFAERVYGDQPSFSGHLELEFADGSTRIVATGQEWRASGTGPVTDSGIYAGEHHDLRLDRPGWSRTGFDDTGWSAVRVVDTELPRPEARIAPPVHRTGELPVVDLTVSPSGRTILDFGQNLVGRLRVTVDGPAGTRIVLRHAEVLEQGELAVGPLRAAEATDSVILDGSGPVTWEPVFTFHGFRYASVEGWPGEVDPAAVTAVVLNTDLTRTGWFASSDPLLDRFHENVVWGMRGNFLSIPTDCPQRDERLGWTGDIQVFAPTASFLFDCEGFLASWLRDLAQEQRRRHGVVPVVVPAVLAGPFIGTIAGWGDAATVVPWVLHQRFGDLGVLREQYSSMRDWVDAVLAETGDSGLWAGTFQLGDWLDPSAPPDRPDKARADADIVATAYLARSLQIVADSAALLGETADAERYAAAAERTRAAFRSEYVTPAGRMLSDAPTAYALALEFGLVTDAAVRERLATRLAVLVRRDGYRIGTGFLGTPLVTDALAGGGHLAAAGRLLLQTENPSWLYPVTMGATTVWERWDSLLEDGTVNPGEMTSFNHYALGAVADWMHRTVAGLGPEEPGYRRLRIAPRPLSQLDFAEARHRTPYGEASVSWTRTGDRITVTAVVPANTSAVVALPGRDEFVVTAGRHEFVFDDTAGQARLARPSLSLESSTAEIIDDPAAYRATLAAIASVDPGLADGFRRQTEWVQGRTLRQSILFAPAEVYSAVGDALAALTSTDRSTDV
ncbi:alpha-L-rhamnosidase [Herbiconiux ginsengi]|uniref:alpha-L-rhamnosidase n=1 Tax=Herbiconiux ginsengi TaxID=381665 RepID=A0A1H3L9M8_9MICO|nr:alpha-L-rhamnosidase [Herbiconiux ginsengi]SDY60595.1 alpha-L-rhamnosidase [Herbiconiux ginsengi]